MTRRAPYWSIVDDWLLLHRKAFGRDMMISNLRRQGFQGTDAEIIADYKDLLGTKIETNKKENKENE